MEKKLLENRPSVTTILNYWKKQITALLCTLFLILLVGCNNPDASDSNIHKSDDLQSNTAFSKNKEAIQTVLTRGFTCPDKDLIDILNRMKSEGNMTTIGKDVENPVYVNDTELENKLHELYGPYFTDKAYDSFINKYAIPNSTIADQYGYQITVEKVDVIQDEKDSIGYSFVVYLNYGKNEEDRINGEVTGSAQCLEEGKISYIRFVDDSGMTKKILENK